MYERIKKEFFYKINQGFSYLYNLSSISITLKPEQIQPQVLCPLQAQNERAIDPPRFTLS